MQGHDVDVVNIMTFDYYDRVTRDMGSAAISAAQGLLNRLATQNPSKTTSELWAMEGNTIAPGLDDYPRKTEATSLADAQRLLTFAESNAVGMLSMWAVQRDNGGCPGRPDRTAAPESSRIPGTSAACLRRSRAASGAVLSRMEALEQAVDSIAAAMRFSGVVRIGATRSS